ncbi:hypothetical protein J4447_01565 [Candidatus Pacearchaeota archaeon]|nr:hypothetical protein [Candidatus Pacearchaeota archaeon]
MGGHRVSKTRINGSTAYTLFSGADESFVKLGVDDNNGRGRNGRCTLEIVTALITSNPVPERRYERNIRESEQELSFFEERWMNGNGIYSEEVVRYGIIIGDKKPLKTGYGSNFRIALPHLLRDYSGGIGRDIWKIEVYLDGEVTDGNVEEMGRTLGGWEVRAWNFVKDGHKPKTDLAEDRLYRALELVIGADAIGRILNRRIAHAKKNPEAFVRTLTDRRLGSIWIDGVEIEKSALNLKYYKRRRAMTHLDLLERCREAGELSKSFEITD